MTHMVMHTYIDLNCHLNFCSYKLSSNTGKASQVCAVSVKGGSVRTICPFNLLLFVESNNNEAWLSARYFFHSKCMLAGEIPRSRMCSEPSLRDQIVPFQEMSPIQFLLDMLYSIYLHG